MQPDPDFHDDPDPTPAATPSQPVDPLPNITAEDPPAVPGGFPPSFAMPNPPRATPPPSSVDSITASSSLEDLFASTSFTNRPSAASGPTLCTLIAPPTLSFLSSDLPLVTDPMIKYLELHGWENMSVVILGALLRDAPNVLCFTELAVQAGFRDGEAQFLWYLNTLSK